MVIENITRDYAQDLDDADPLAAFRRRFRLPEDVIYLDGNSLGPAPEAVFDEMNRAIELEWAQDLITSWNKAGWFELPGKLGGMIAELTGADDDEVIVSDTTSINLHKTLHAGLALRPERLVIVSEGGSFPTDLYVIEGVMQTRSGITRRLEGVDGDRIEDLIDDDVAVVLVNQVDYRTGRLRDMAAVTRKAHEAGAVVVWDLCHSAGVLPVDLNGCEVDLAVGCTYKYLNGGPGAPAFVFAARRHHAALTQPLTGWWGHASPFAFDRAFSADPGIGKFQCGTQPVLSLRALKAGLELYGDVDLQLVRVKSMALTDLFIALVESRCAEFGLILASPRATAERGSQVSFAHGDGYRIMQALIARGVIGDFRAPDILRFGFAPLYIRFVDIWDAVEHLREVLESGEWQDEQFAVRAAVT